MGAGNIKVLVFFGRKFDPPPVGKIAFYKNQIIAEIGNSDVILNKSP
jgi:hypothetical protein